MDKIMNKRTKKAAELDKKIRALIVDDKEVLRLLAPHDIYGILETVKMSLFFHIEKMGIKKKEQLEESCT